MRVRECGVLNIGVRTLELLKRENINKEKYGAAGV